LLLVLLGRRRALIVAVLGPRNSISNCMWSHGSRYITHCC
jgi:hypothetical protein